MIHTDGKGTAPSFLHKLGFLLRSMEYRIDLCFLYALLLKRRARGNGETHTRQNFPHPPFHRVPQQPRRLTHRGRSGQAGDE